MIVNKDEEVKSTPTILETEEPKQNANSLGSTYTIKKEEKSTKEKSIINNEEEDVEKFIENFRNDVYEKDAENINKTDNDALQLDIDFKNKPDKFNDVS